MDLISTKFKDARSVFSGTFAAQGCFGRHRGRFFQLARQYLSAVVSIQPLYSSCACRLYLALMLSFHQQLLLLIIPAQRQDEQSGEKNFCCLLITGRVLYSTSPPQQQKTLNCETALIKVWIVDTVFSSDPGKPGVRSLGLKVRPSVSHLVET